MLFMKVPGAFDNPNNITIHLYNKHIMYLESFCPLIDGPHSNLMIPAPQINFLEVLHHVISIADR